MSALSGTARSIVLLLWTLTWSSLLLELVDAIELLDEHRTLLTTYVHLSPLANELLALAIADGIARQFGCPQLGLVQ